jgi:hypothetical protein
MGASGVFSILVQSPLQIITETLPNAQVEEHYSKTLQASGGVTPLTWSIASGSLPAGLHLSSGGTISGTPLEANEPGSFYFTVQVVDSSQPQQTATRAYKLVLLPDDENRGPED